MCFFFTAYRPVEDAAAELTVKMYGLLTAKREKQNTEMCLIGTAGNQNGSLTFGTKISECNA